MNRMFLMALGLASCVAASIEGELSPPDAGNEDPIADGAIAHDASIEDAIVADDAEPIDAAFEDAEAHDAYADAEVHPDAELPAPVCGDTICSGLAGETCTSCPMDCDTRDVVCGNGECQPGETSASCFSDCGPEPWPELSAMWEEEALMLINAERAAGTDCASGPKDPVPPLVMDPALQVAARLHSFDMSWADYHSHESCNGRHFTERAAAQGTFTFAENIAWGFGTAPVIVGAWMGSLAGHCDAIMNPGFEYIGLGQAERRYTAMFR
jgi:uncharacterized protein YkwD